MVAMQHECGAVTADLYLGSLIALHSIPYTLLPPIHLIAWML